MQTSHSSETRTSQRNSKNSQAKPAFNRPLGAHCSAIEQRAAIKVRDEA